MRWKRRRQGEHEAACGDYFRQRKGAGAKVRTGAVPFEVLQKGRPSGAVGAVLFISLKDTARLNDPLFEAIAADAAAAPLGISRFPDGIAESQTTDSVFFC